MGKNILDSLCERLIKLRISTRIMLFYGVLVIISLSLSGLIYQRYYYNVMFTNVSEASIQTLQSIKVSLNSLVNTVQGYTKLIISDKQVEDILSSPEDEYEKRPVSQTTISKTNSKVYNQNKMKDLLTRFKSNMPEVSSVYILNNSKTRYFVSIAPEGNIPLKINMNKKNKWYVDVVNKKGGMVIKPNGGGAFEGPINENFISCMRVINDINTQKPIGILILNIGKKELQSKFAAIAQKQGTSILRDEYDWDIVYEGNRSISCVDQTIASFENNSYAATVLNSGDKKQMFSYLRDDRLMWKIISITPYNEVSYLAGFTDSMFLLIILINSLLIIIGSLALARMITNPVNKLVGSMETNKNGQFREVKFDTNIYEFAKLRDGYNLMIYEIKKLIDRIIQEQKIKRKTELQVLQAQIKPHFLYNTFDAISSLSLMGRNEEVYKAMVALGRYYRASLSRGHEIITIEEEIDITKNYLSILKIRYGDIFLVNFDVDEKVLKNKILKLVLQPLVENALYHGIKPKCEQGIINVRAEHLGDEIKLTIEDDGVGMSEDMLENLVSSREQSKGDGFGLKGTIERLRIFYGREDVLYIESKKWHGTRVVIRIPAKEGEENVS